MSRYHVNPATGDCNICKAQPGNCRFGEENHYPSMGEAQDASEQLIAGNANTTAQSMVKNDNAVVNQPVQEYHDILTDEQRAQLENAIQQDSKRFYIHEFPDGTNADGDTLRNKQVLMFKHRSPDDETSKIDHIYMQFADENYPDDGTSITCFLDRFNELYGDDNVPDYERYQFDEVLGDSSVEYYDEKYEFDADEWNRELDKVSELARRVAQDDPSMDRLCSEVLRMTDDVRAESVYDWRALPTAHVSMTEDDYMSYCEGFYGVQLYDDDDYDYCDEEEMEELLDEGGLLASNYSMDNRTVRVPFDDMYGKKIDEYEQGQDYWTYDYHNDFTDPKLGNYWQQEAYLAKAADRYGVPLPTKDFKYGSPSCTPDRWNICMDLIVQEAESDRYREMIHTGKSTEADEIIRRANLLKITEVHASSDIDDYCPRADDWDEWREVCEDAGVLYV